MRKKNNIEVQKLLARIRKTNFNNLNRTQVNITKNATLQIFTNDTIKNRFDIHAHKCIQSIKAKRVYLFIKTKSKFNLLIKCDILENGTIEYYRFSCYPEFIIKKTTIQEILQSSLIQDYYIDEMELSEYSKLLRSVRITLHDISNNNIDLKKIEEKINYI